MSHHSDGPPPEESKVLRELMAALGQPLGPTGKHPVGKITPSDDGEIRIAIGTSHGRTVVIDFGKPVTWIGFNKAQALDIAETLRKHAETL